MSINRTEELARLFEAVERGDVTLEACLLQHPEFKDDLLGMIYLTQKIQAISLPEPDLRFRSAARQRILTTLKAHQPVTFENQLRHVLQNIRLFSIRRPAMAIAIVLALVLSLMGGSIGYASQGAIPGDFLYPLKLQVEELKLAAASNEMDENLYYRFAKERVDEGLEAVKQGRYEDIPAAMRGFESAAENVKPDTATGLSNSLSILSDLLANEQVPPEAVPGLMKAIEALNQAQEKLDNAAPAGPPSNLPVDVPAEKPGTIPPVNPPVTAPPVVVPPVVPPVNAQPVEIPPVVPPVEAPPVEAPPVEPPVAPPVEVPPVEPPVEVPVEVLPVTPPVVQPPAGRP
jgi:hypothetical protein